MAITNRARRKQLEKPILRVWTDPLSDWMHTRVVTLHIVRDPSPPNNMATLPQRNRLPKPRFAWTKLADHFPAPPPPPRLQPLPGEYPGTYRGKQGSRWADLVVTVTRVETKGDGRRVTVALVGGKAGAAWTHGAEDFESLYERFVHDPDAP